jgi:hypothetical protein
MGVYVFQSRHAPLIKIGHYNKSNAWSRVAHRGFHSCLHPSELKGRVSVDDLELVCWFPERTPKDEKALHRLCDPYRVKGEWFTIEALLMIPWEDNQASECIKEAAMATRRRL